MNEKKYPVKRGAEYQLEIEKLSFGGAGVARAENYVIFVKGALPGDKVRARILKRKPSFAEAVLLEIVSPSPQRIDAPCPYFNWCGGCTWQSLEYRDQLEHKKMITAESLEHIAGISAGLTADVLPSEKKYAYRNKMEFSFSDRRWLLPDELGREEISRDFALGLHVPGTFDKIIQIDSCLLQSETANQILKYISDFARKNGPEPYGIKSHKGFWRFLVLRQSRFSGEIMVNLVTAYKETKLLKELAQELTEAFPQVSSVVNNINARLAQTAAGDEEILLAGKAFIQDKLGDFIFNISANSFFQTNTQQAEKLYEKVIEFAGIDKNDIVWDLYAGTGTISLFLAKRAARVIGFEIAESAVFDAVKNAEEHGIHNTRIIAGDLLNKLQETEPKPDILVTDPPRAGMHEKVVRYITKILPERMVYVSCNPATLARDLSILKENYTIEKVQPVDMFPQTYHIETVVQLSRKLND